MCSRVWTLLFLSALGISGAAGCSLSPPVKPWQRGYMTKRAMRFDTGMETRFRQHMYSSREGADGGYGHAGGGCGCN